MLLVLASLYAKYLIQYKKNALINPSKSVALKVFLVELVDMVDLVGL